MQHLPKISSKFKRDIYLFSHDVCVFSVLQASLTESRARGSQAAIEVPAEVVTLQDFTEVCPPGSLPVVTGFCPFTLRHVQRLL